MECASSSIDADGPERGAAFVEDRKKSLTVLLFFTFFMVTGFEMIMPLVIGHYVDDLGFLATKVAFALAVRKFSQQGLAMFGGLLADRRDIRTLISLGMFLRVLGFSALGFTRTFPGLLLSMVFIGFGGVLFEPAYQTAIAFLTTDGNRARYLSLNNTVVGVASTLGPLIGALLLRVDFRGVCFGAAACFLTNLMLALFYMPRIRGGRSPVSVRHSFSVLAGDGRYLRFVGLMVVFWLAASQIDLSFPLRIREISGTPESVSWMYSIYAAITALFQYPLVSWLLRRHGERRIAAVGTGIVALSLFCVPFVARTGPFLALVALLTLGMLLARPNQQSLALSLAKREATGLYVGFNALGFAVGSGGGAILGGVLFDLSRLWGTPTLPWVLYGAVALAAAAGFARGREFDGP